MSELSDKQHKLANIADEVANLDLLRSIAVMSVFLGHLHNFMRPGIYSNVGWHFAQMGVLAFFVHTSLVLMFSLERQQKAGQPIFASFYIRRWFRIYPLSIVCVILVYLSGIGGKAWTFGDLATNLTLTQNVFRHPNMLSVLWTLPLEVQMYVLLPFLFVFLRQRSWIWVVGLLALSIPIAVWQLQTTDRLNILGYIPCFLGGLLAWRLSRSYSPMIPGWAWPFGIFAVALIWFTAVNMSPYDMYLRWVFCGSLGAIIPMFHSMSETLLTRVAAIIAKYSYGIYLSHIPVMIVAFRILAHSAGIIQWGTFIVLACVAPVMAYHFLEEPMINVGKWLAKRWPTIGAWGAAVRVE